MSKPIKTPADLAAAQRKLVQWILGQFEDPHSWPLSDDDRVNFLRAVHYQAKRIHQSSPFMHQELEAVLAESAQLDVRGGQVGGCAMVTIPEHTDEITVRRLVAAIGRSYEKHPVKTLHRDGKLLRLELGAPCSPEETKLLEAFSSGFLAARLGTKD